MPKTATRAASTTQTTPAKKTKSKARNSTTVEVDLGDAGKAILDKMAEHRQVRLTAQKEEDILKKQLKELLPKQKKHEKLLVRAAGVIRGTSSWRGRKNTDLDLLLQGWPEAYEACVTENVYTQFDPA
jgi:hypothetical protein